MIAFYVIPILALVFSFAAGYLLGQVDSLSGARPLPALLRQAGLDTLAAQIPVSISGESGLAVEDRERFETFWEAWELVNREFYLPDKLDRQQMVYGAVRGMLATLDDPATLFLDPVSGEIADADLRGSFDGIGVQVDVRDNRLTVVAPLEGSPGEKAGIKPGDIILAVDGEPVEGMTLQEAVTRIRGPRGTTVTLTIGREGESELLTFAVQRDEIKIESVRFEMLDGGVGYLRINSFGSETGAETKAALTELLKQNPRGLVLDLRSNPGGYVTAAIDVASEFVESGVVFYQQPARGEREEIRTHGGGLATTLPVVVLVDGGSASASEIVAAALRDNGRASLVGVKTFGKGTVQTVHELSDRSSMRVTIAQWLTPSGVPLHGNGLVPDQIVELPDDLEEGQDPQLSAAVERLNGGA